MSRQEYLSTVILPFFFKQTIMKNEMYLYIDRGQRELNKSFIYFYFQMKLVKTGVT